jgi:archaemetzincin
MIADVYLWWIGADAPDGPVLEQARRHVERAFGVTVRMFRGADRPTHAFDPRRGQHSSTQILRWLVGRDQPGGRVLAITDMDLFIPVLTFVYGEAQLGGTAAVVSTARLSPGPEVGDPRARLADRVVKECVHELGHTFGLLHCDTRGCVMTRSVNLLDVDMKNAALCDDCHVRYLDLRQKGGDHE